MHSALPGKRHHVSDQQPGIPEIVVVQSSRFNWTCSICALMKFDVCRGCCDDDAIVKPVTTRQN